MANRRIENDDVLLQEVRTTNRLLAVLVSKGLEQRKAIELLNGLGFQPKQIAAALGTSANAVSIALHRLRKSASRAETDGDSANVEQ